MAFNIINPSGLCPVCGKQVPKHMGYCTLKCRNRAYHLRRRKREIGMEDEGVVYEGARVPEANVPPFPECSSETLELVASGLAVGQSAWFERPMAAGIVPEGCSWEIAGELGKLTKIATRSVE